MDSPVKTFAIQNEFCRRSGIAAEWLPINSLGVFPNQMVKWSGRDTPSAYSLGQPASVFIVRQEVVLFHPILRKLVNEASGMFVNVQTLVAANPSDLKSELLQCSMQYRSVIRACLEDLRDEIMRTERNTKEDLQSYVTIFYSVECIWHLCEILYIDNIPGYAVVKHLLEWVRFHFPKYERRAAMLLSEELMGIESHPEYWKTIIGSILQGRIEIARTLLALHTSARSAAFKLAEQILKTLPTYDVFEGIPANEFNVRWRHWLVDAQSKIDAQMFVNEPKLDYIMRLVIGEESAWNTAQAQCETWYELLAAWLFYTEPMVKSFELGKFAKRCIGRMDTHLHHLDRVLLAAMEGDVELIKEIQHLTDNGWFATHLTDLLFHCGQLDKWKSEDVSSAKLRESFLLEYGSLLMGHKSMWQIGLNYLDHCPSDGIATIELLLPRIRMDSEMKANKIIREAQKRELFHIVQSISRVQAVNFMRKNRLGNALMWALKSQDTILISHLADSFLRIYTETGELPNTDLLNNLGSCMMASDRLIFLGKYYEFYKLYKSEKFREAASALVSLIASKFTPKFFWPSLLAESISLLQSDELILSTNDTYNLLNCLEDRADMPGLQDKLEIIRLGIAKNLSRALTFDAQYV